MSAEQTYQWLQVCLQPADTPHALLTNNVYPYIRTVLETGMADSFSFSRRPGSRGLIQLYFKGQTDVLQHMLAPNTTHFFQRVLARRAVICAPYYPEPQRYGGVTGHFLSMLQYRSSSETVLEQLYRNGAYWNASRALETARRLHLDLLFRARMEPAAGAVFFTQLNEHFQHGYGTQLGNGARYAANAERLLEADRYWWQLLRTDPPTDESWRRWDSMQQIISNSLQRALAQGKLCERPPTELLRVQRRGNHDQAQLWSFYADFVRLTNNRLGLSVEDEGYLYYSMAKSLHALSLETNQTHLATAV